MSSDPTEVLPAVVARPLSQPEARFVAEYLVDHNATRAYIASGHSVTHASAAQLGSQMLRRPHVAAEVRRLEDEELARIRSRAGVSLEKTLTQVNRLAMYDARNLFNEDGSPKQISELDDATAAAIEGVEVLEQYEGSGDERRFVGYLKKYRLAKKTPALEMLMKHLNGYAADNDSKGQAVANGLTALLGQMRKSALPIVERVGDNGGV